MTASAILPRQWARRRLAHATPASPRVVIIVQNLPVPLDRRVWLECRALVGAGYGVTVVCPKGPGDRSHEVIDGVVLRKYRPLPPVDGALGYLLEFTYCWLRTALLVARVARREGFDVLQACNPPDTFFLLGLIAKACGKQFVYDQHDLCPELYLSRPGSPARMLLRTLRLLESLTYRTADHVISTNESYRSIALDRGRRRAGDVTVVRSGPNLERLYAVEPQPELKGGRDHLCCYLGVMGRQDRVDIVLRAADVIVREMGRTDVHFALLGFGDCLGELRDLSRTLGLDDFVTFTGRANDTMIRSYLSTADVALSPDPKVPLNDVSTMNKTLEYMAFALPIVSFDLKETRVSAGDAAVYVGDETPAAYAKAIVALIDDPRRREEMGSAGLARIRERLSWGHQAPVYVRVFDRLLARRAVEHREVAA